MKQKTALGLLRAGHNIFLTGEPGAGKTHTINEYTAYLQRKKIMYAVTASTGIAATHIGGATIHAWSGIGIAQELDEASLKKITGTSHIAKRIRKTSVLIIDEISMLDGRVLDLIEVICRTARRSTLPFGGMQVVLVGDFFQLPPVRKGKDDFLYAFEGSAWQWLRPVVCYLDEQHRQADKSFLALLRAIRKGAIEEHHYEALRAAFPESEEDVPLKTTRLYSHNTDVDSLNSKELGTLTGHVFRYTMQETGASKLAEVLRRNCLSPETLELKIGALVMFTKNNPSSGYVNGTQGTVVSFDEVTKLPVVKTVQGKKVAVMPMDWELYEGEVSVARVTQLPLRLAWALTIHKSQGVSLDRAIMDLSKVFEYGQGYVALSRVRSLKGITLLGMNNRALEVDPRSKAFDVLAKEASVEAAAAYAALTPTERKKQEENFVLISGGSRG
jgi:ATP-dependent DNA helicase PIF1